MDADAVLTSVREISTDVAICGKENIIVFNTDGSIKEEKDALECIDERTSTRSIASHNTSDEGLFAFDSSTGTILGFKDGQYAEDIVIPNKINGVTVTKIAASAFHMQRLKSVVLPNTLTTIENFWK